MIGPIVDREEAVSRYHEVGGYLIRISPTQHWIAEDDGDALDLLDGNRATIIDRLNTITDNDGSLLLLDASTLALVLA